MKKIKNKRKNTKQHNIPGLIYDDLIDIAVTSAITPTATATACVPINNNQIVSP